MSFPPPEDPVRRIALAYAPSAQREALAALWALDERLGQIVTTTREPMIGQMRLSWWHERLEGLDGGETVAEPLLTRLAAADLRAVGLAGLVEGWEALLDPMPLGSEPLAAFAKGRGGGLFEISTRVLGGSVDPVLGEGWALIDFAARCSDRDTRTIAWTMARERLAGRPVDGPRPLRILAHVARGKATAVVDRVTMEPSRLALLRAVLR